MSQLLVLLILVAGAGLITWSASRLRRFEEAYRYDSGFPGRRYETTWRLPAYESPYRGLAGADPTALYLFRPPGPRRFTDRLSHRYSEFRYDLRIPWRDIEWRARRVLGRKSIWFDIPSHKTCLYLPAEIGNKLLADAGAGAGPPSDGEVGAKR